MAEITLDVSDAEIRELTVEQSRDSGEVTFSVDGRVAGMDEGKIAEIMRAQNATPVTLVVETE